MNHLVGTALPFSLALCLAAQQAERPLRGSGIEIGTARGVFPCDDQLVAIGAGFKAYFGHGEVEFVPAFGRRAPHNFPLRVRASGLARCGAAVPFLSAPPEPVGKASVQYRRAPGVIELFTVQDGGLEQSFVLDRRPDGTGDLVVTCELQCEIGAKPDGKGGLRFPIDGTGEFTIGAVTAIDAVGRRVGGSLRLEHDTLTLSVPAQFVDGAAYPLVVDPLLGGPTLLSGLDREDPDVVLDPASGDWFAVWAHYTSAGDADVYGQRVSQGNGGLVGPVLVIDASGSNTEFPRVASVRSAGRVLVVYRRPGVIIITPSTLEGRVVNVAAQTVSLAATIASGVDEFAVGSEDTTADNEALVVWGNSTAVDVAQVTVPTSGSPVPSAPVTIATGVYLPSVAISKTNGGTGNYLVAWRTSSTLPLPGQSFTLYGQLVSRNLAILTPVRTLDMATTGRPVIDCSGSAWLVAYTQWEPGSSTLHDVMCVKVLYLATFGSLIVNAGPLPVEATSGQDESLPDIAWLGQRFGVTFTENFGQSNENVGAWLVNTDCTTCSTRMSLQGVTLAGFTQERQAHIAGRAAWQPGVDNGEIVFVEDSPTTPHPFIIGQRILGVGPGGQVVDLGGGCGQGGTAGSTSNGFALGNPDCQFEVTGLEPGALSLCCLAVPAATLTCGTCTFLSPLATYFEPSVAGTASHTFSVPCDPVNLGFLMEVQWVSLLTSTTPCPLVTGLAGSNRVRFAVGP